MKRVIIKRGSQYAMATHVIQGYRALVRFCGNKARLRVAGALGILIERFGRLEGQAIYGALKHARIIRAIGLNPENKRETIWALKRVSTVPLGYGHTKYHLTKSRQGVPGQRRPKRVCAVVGVTHRLKDGECRQTLTSVRLLKQLVRAAGFPEDRLPDEVHMVYYNK